MKALTPCTDTEASSLLLRMVEEETLPSTILISAPTDSGKRELAFRCAAALLKDATGGALRGEHTDLGVFDYGDKSFKVDDSRNLRTEAFKSPAVADFRVFVIVHVQNMTPEAQNALLKLLEEPPARLYMFLLCENEDAMLQTIRSRCMKVRLSPPEETDALDILRERFPELSDEELVMSLRYSGGWPEGAAERLNEQAGERCGDLLDLSEMLIEAALNQDELELWKPIMKLGKQKRQYVSELVEILRERLSIRILKDPRDARLLRLDALAVRMQQLLFQNVNPTHVLQVFPEYFAQNERVK